MPEVKESKPTLMRLKEENTINDLNNNSPQDDSRVNGN